MFDKCNHTTETIKCPNCSDSLCPICALVVGDEKLHRECSASRRNDRSLLEDFLEEGEKFRKNKSFNKRKGKMYPQKSSCSFEFDMDAKMFLFMAWTSGEVEVSIAEIKNLNQTYNSYVVIQNKEEMQLFIKDALKKAREKLS